jgi:hypothetical protein
MFDHIDFVFIDGDSSYFLPWTIQAKKVILNQEQCIDCFPIQNVQTD